MKKIIIYLHTGSNLGERKNYLAQAREMIRAQIGKILRSSHLYETEAWGVKDQPNFINQALKIRTELVPEEILFHIKKIEKEIGRKENERWHERIIDIDILFYDDKRVSTENLKIPHPHCHERMFVLVPLMEIAGNYIHPQLKMTIEDLYLECEDPLEVIMLDAPYQYNQEEEE